MAAPAMMAIEDSLFNGVRSLTINQQLAQWSAPAQVARALGILFAIPDYPRNVVINFEQWLREFPNLIGVAADVANNIGFWDTSPKSNLPEFDNIAVASALYADLWTRTANVAQGEINALHGQLGTKVSIGANNGLWEMGFAAEAPSGSIGGQSGPFNEADVADLVTLVNRLKALPADIAHIYVNALPLPSGVADMMPVPDVSDSHKPGPGKYYPLYENRFGFNYATLTATQIAANDATVRAINARLAEGSVEHNA